MTYIISIAAIIATTVITSVVEHFSARLITSFTRYTPKNKRVALLISLITKYIFFAILTALFISEMDLNKTFVVSIALLILICSYYIARDVLFYNVRSVTFTLESENIQSQIDTYIRALGRCDSKNRDKQDEYIKKIQELTEQKDAYK